jgi:hypothetical protein
MLQRLHASFTWRDPCSHPQTGPPDSATSPVIVLYSRALCARLCVLELPPSPAGPVFGFGSQLPPRLRILHVCTRAHTLSLDSFCRPTAGKSSIPAGLSPLVYAYVVDCASASPYAYSSSTHRFPDERTLSRPRLFQRHLWSLGCAWVWVWDWILSSHVLSFFSPPSIHTLSLSPAFTSVWWSA